jgi:hypothetical protein
MTTDQIKTELKRLVADWKIVAAASEADGDADCGTGSDAPYAKARAYRDAICDLEQIIKEEE